MRCSAVLLAGGKSSRMGRDKALLEIDGQPLWRRQLETLRALNPEQLMVSGRTFDGAEAVVDRWTNAGPLAGVAAALERCSAPLLVVLAVDLPRMTSRFLESLLAAAREGRGVVPRGAEFYEPLAAVYPITCVAAAEAALQRGEFSLQRFVEAAVRERSLEPRVLRPEELPLFANWNSPEDL